MHRPGAPNNQTAESKAESEGIWNKKLAWLIKNVKPMPVAISKVPKRFAASGFGCLDLDFGVGSAKRATKTPATKATKPKLVN